MSAEKMFKELGLYEEISCVGGSKIWCVDEETKIIFDAFDHEILLYSVSCIPLEVLKAINKQIEELGWSDSNE